VVVPLSARNPSCPIARTLEIVGERWSLLIIREALKGATRFAGFRERLGVAPDVLTARLATLVEHGILERRPYRDGGRTREEYVLTPAGRDLAPVLVALSDWGGAHLPEPVEPSSVAVEVGTGLRVRIAVLEEGGREVRPGDIRLQPREELGAPR
jgi:DNA-binding HxlR family transcriptional regulator